MAGTIELDLTALLFKKEATEVTRRSVYSKDASREERQNNRGATILTDRFSYSGAECGFLRLQGNQGQYISFRVPGQYDVHSCNGGGWILERSIPSEDCYWVPRLPIQRWVSASGHILKEAAIPELGFQITSSCVRLKVDILEGGCLDFVVWRVPSQQVEFIEELTALRTIEVQPRFLWGSHTKYRRPADVYQHLVFGHVYENRYLWPYNRKGCSENDAHSLYVTLSGLQRATGKRLYKLLKDQLLISVLARQSSDGGWHHGEWSEDMEAHMRLNGSALHLLLDFLEEREDPNVREALHRGVKFLIYHQDKLEIGTWLLHDSLELSEEGMKKSPFKWQKSRTLGKSSSNMLVLNTHLDSLVLLDRFRSVTGDASYDALVMTARRATRAVLNLRPLEPIYRILFYLLRLNLIPTQAQRELSIPLRATKRLVWKWLTPNFYRLAARFPRFVMPGGYIQRSIPLQGMADDYHSINVMDLLRYWRRFPEENIERVIAEAINFVQRNGIQRHWGENKWTNYALGFWAEALYHRYLIAPDREGLSDLAGILVELESFGVGIPPSFLGANAESVPFEVQIACPSPSDSSLRVANLSRKGRVEFLVVNPTSVVRRLTWENEFSAPLVWESNREERFHNGDDVDLPAGTWIVGRPIPEIVNNLC